MLQTGPSSHNASQQKSNNKLNPSPNLRPNSSNKQKNRSKSNRKNKQGKIVKKCDPKMFIKTSSGYKKKVIIKSITFTENKKNNSNNKETSSDESLDDKFNFNPDPNVSKNMRRKTEVIISASRFDNNSSEPGSDKISQNDNKIKKNIVNRDIFRVHSNPLNTYIQSHPETSRGIRTDSMPDINKGLCTMTPNSHLKNSRKGFNSTKRTTKCPLPIKNRRMSNHNSFKHKHVINQFAVKEIFGLNHKIKTNYMDFNIFPKSPLKPKNTK